MAFSDGTLDRVYGANSDAGALFAYKENATLAAIRAANYFNDALASYGLKDEDLILIIGSDGFGISQVSVSGVNVTVGESVTSS